jgi:hypothetical protein
MQTYFYLGHYTEPKWQEVLASSKDNGTTISNSISQCRGKVVASFLLSPIGLAEFPNDAWASEWTRLISKQPGIQSFELYLTSGPDKIADLPLLKAESLH